jgi:tetratricopeptide (TPR) repeat protein
MGDKMSYNIAMDQLPPSVTDGNMGAMAKGWMQAAGQNGIPTAFIVDKTGKIAWIGHPMAMEGPLEKVVNGTYSSADYEKARKDQELALRMSGFDNRLREAMGSNDEKGILKIMDEMMADSNKEIQAQGGMMKFSFLIGKKQYTDAYAVGNKLVTMFKNDSDRLNSLAWAIVDPQGGVEKKDLDLALKAAKRSVELDKNPANMDTLARVYFVKGDKAKALEIEKEALKMAPDSDKKSYEDTIKEFGG